MTVQYVARSPKDLARYVASNLTPKKYFFYATFAVPADADVHAVDLKLLIKYDCWRPKEWQYRRRKAGLCTVRYVRCGRVGYLFATRGRGDFFTQEPFKDVRVSPVCIAGHSIRVIPDSGKTVVRVHREAMRRLRFHLLENARLPLRELETLVWNIDLLPFAGVRDGVFAALKELNEHRRRLRLLPVDWKRCVRKRIPTGPIFEPTPAEVAEVLDWYRREQRR